MKIKKKIEDCYLTVTITCGFREHLDLEMLERFAKKSIPFFLKVKSCKSKKAVYTGIRAVSLKEYLNKPISKFDFYFILAQFARLIKNAEDNNLPLCHISYDLKNCFLTEGTKELQLLYLPVKSSTVRNLPNDFLERLIYTATLGNGEDFISDFAYFYRNQIGFNAKAIERYIANEEPKVYQLLDNKKYVEIRTEKIQRNEAKNLEISKIKKLKSDDDLTLPGDVNVGSGDEENTLLADDQTLIGESDETVLGDENNDDETAYLNVRVASIFPYLKRQSTGEIIKLTKSCFRIGSKESEVDYAVRNNNTISRSHADFIIDSGNYFVYDLSSKNKTFVNNRVIPVQTRVQIYHNDIVRLSDEEFTFCVE